MQQKISDRLQELLDEGKRLLARLPRGTGGDLGYFVSGRVISECQSWIASCGNIIENTAPAGSAIATECGMLLKGSLLREAITAPGIQRLYGLLEATKREWDSGLLARIEYVVVAATLDDFLDYAAEYHRGNMKNEAAVLASAVLENTVKRLSIKSELDTRGKSLEECVDLLVKAGALTLVKAKRVKSYAGVRNHALHAEWDEFDIRDVGQMIEGVRELVETHL
jgi:hypothetical protein